MVFDLRKLYTLWRSGRIDGWLMRGEPGYLYDLAQKYIPPNGRAVEVGSWKGKSTYILASVCRKKGAQLTSIDTFSGNIVAEGGVPADNAIYKEAEADPDLFFRTHIARSLRGFPVDYLKMTSARAAAKIKNASLDFCFIDGDHTLPVVYQDIRNYLPKVKKGGLLLGHDYSPVANPANQVKDSVDQLIGSSNIQVFQSVWIYRRRV
jgi:predicted O-methyltransferase YrrM